MSGEKISKKTADFLVQLLKKYPLVPVLVQIIADAGGRALLVGGAVRDLLLGLQTKDLDIEIHGLTADQLQACLQKKGKVSLVGKQFGVYRLHGLDVDWSLPRTDSAGRKPEVKVDPFMDSTTAFARRDLTINAMGIDLLTSELLDPFNGQKDLKNKVLRAPDSEFFVQDPLRLFRVMQFISRFAMQPDDQLNMLCKTMDISTISVERIEMEFEKLLLKSKKPSLGIRWLNFIGRLKEVLPELEATTRTQQNPEWHPEGSVFEHTMQAVDAAAALEYDSIEQKLIVLYAALCHDLGKVTTTKKIDGVLRSLGHAQESERLCKKLLKRITGKKDLIKAVSLLVKYHMLPGQFIDNGAKPAAYKRLAHKLAPHATLTMLAQLARADKRGRNQKGGIALSIKIPAVDQFLYNARQAQVDRLPEPPLLQGKDFLGLIKPGPHMGTLLKQAYEIQLEQGITDKNKLKELVLDTSE